ncbi:MAG: CPBP family intramembrane metalloprotease [Clostridiales bacterium]|nr:CPBP family intramembrane metalloprotease [Clostridiales bacterium]
MKYYNVEGNKKSIKKVFAIYYICMAVFCVLRVLASVITLPISDALYNTLFSLIIQIGILCLLPFGLYMLLLKVKPREALQHCNAFRINWVVILISVVLGILCFFINIAVSSLFNGMLAFTGYEFPSGGGESDYSVGNFFLQIFLVAVIPAIAEEFLHRGLLLQGIKHIGFKKAIIISSLMFALLHFNIQQVFYAFVLGLIMGFVSVVAKNIWPAVIIHFVNNAISVYIDFASAKGWVFGNVLDLLESFLMKNNIFVIFVVISLVMVVIVSLLCLFIWLLYRQALVRRVHKAIDKAYEQMGSAFASPIKVSDSHEVIVDLIESSTLIDLEAKVLDNPINAVMPKEKSRYKASYMDMVFLWGGVVLGALVTIFTYVWGLL